VRLDGGAVSQPQPLQERILTVLGEHSPVPARNLRDWLPDVDLIALDCGVKGLLKANKVSLSLGAYDLVRPQGRDITHMKRANGIELVESPAPASEEVAASLAPAGKMLMCADCGLKPESHFQHSTLGKPFRVCTVCLGKRQNRGRTIRKSRSLNRSEGNPALPVQSKLGRQTVVETPHSTNENSPESPEKRGNNRDVSAERCCEAASVPETSGSYSRSDPREDARTPAGSSIAFPRSCESEEEVMANDPEPQCAAGLSSHVDAGAASAENTGSNISTEASAVSPRASPDKQPPAAADSAVGRTDVLARIGRKREQITQKIGDLMAQLAQVNELEASIMALLEEAV
jgi:hypothetical protein